METEMELTCPECTYVFYLADVEYLAVCTCPKCSYVDFIEEFVPMDWENK